VAWKEHRVQTLCDMMAGVVSATVKHAEKQQTRTAEEREAEVREEEFGQLPDVGAADKSAKKHGHNDDDDEDAPVYNPLNLPLGWDGKPIPYWMYKLHGLGVEYKCQICGDQSYWGRRAFDRHFQEWKHAHGMRSLGIPNTKHFHDITQIEDAKALYNKIKSEISVGQFQNDMEEEFEDTHGNVLNRRTYEDLARQGLL
jgi:splicing factor 3A subunit 3